MGNCKSCKSCEGDCCKYIAIEIDVPETKEDFENIKWFVCHENVNVYVNEEGEWYVEFITPCEFLGENNKCKIYDKRPKICRGYNHDECTFHNGYSEKHRFKILKDVENYIGEKFGDETKN
ncbi:MAG: YkgJ family cysteine cluster protein [Nanoarchaeota archaeon]|nr:YkgJ family cysteine cluster protein [Nanoarchaeota archaeon]